MTYKLIINYKLSEVNKHTHNHNIATVILANVVKILSTFRCNTRLISNYILYYLCTIIVFNNQERYQDQFLTNIIFKV